MAREKLVKTQYVGKDFDTFWDDLVERANSVFSEELSGSSASDDPILKMILDSNAYGLGGLAWYLDKYVNNLYLSTTTDRVIAARIARQSGYKPARASSATTDLQVSLSKAYAFDVTISTGFKFKTSTGLVYEAMHSVTWVAGDISAKTLTVGEGETRKAVFVSTGGANQRFRLPGTDSTSYVIGTTMLVLVAGTPWTEVELMQAEPLNIYEVEYDESPPMLRFGNNLSGNIPKADAEIRVSYRIGHGKLGNVIQGSIAKESVPLFVNGTSISLVVSQPDKATGGDDPESLDSIKANAPRYFAARHVAVTRTDYEALASSFNDPQYGRPAKVSALNTRSAEDDPELNIHITSIEDDLDALQTSVQGSVDSAQTSSATIGTALTSLSACATEAGVQATAASTAESQVSASILLLAQYAASLSAKLTEVDGFADDIVDENASSSTVSNANAIKALVVDMVALSSSVQDQANALGGPKNSLDTMTSALTDLGTDITTAVSSASSARANIDTKMTAIETVLGTYDTSISASLADIFNHVDEHWSAASQANIVTVPLVTKDQDGFYTEPSLGLMRALQNYLDDKKDVTHTVNVVSGGYTLVAATVSIKVKVLTNYVVSAVLAQVEAQANALLKDRDYGERLVLQSFYDIKKNVEGVDYLNVTLGPSGKRDADGNLVITVTELVTRGSVTVQEAD